MANDRARRGVDDRDRVLRAVGHEDAQAVRRGDDVPRLGARRESGHNARAEGAPDTWMPVLLFVIPDFGASQLGTFTPISGTWPPPERGLLVEREVLPMLKRGLGDDLTVKTPNGPKRNMPIVGSVHDPSLAPAWQEQTMYGYITPATLAWLGEGDVLHILKIGLRDQPADAATIAADIRDLSGWLTQQGYRVDEIRIPPPLKHPHQSQMNAVLTLLLNWLSREWWTTKRPGHWHIRCPRHRRRRTWQSLSMNWE